MANRAYKPFKVLLLKGDIDLENDTIKAALIDTADYTFDQAHDFLNDASAGIVGAPQTLANKTFTDGVFNADDVTFPTVSGDPCEAVILYKDTGNPATSPLIAYIDTATGLPVTPNGGNVAVQWHSSGILALTDV
jgi:hypothetical protein